MIIFFLLDTDCGTINNVASKYSHLTNALTDLVEAYEDGKTSFGVTRDDLVDSLHILDSKITNEGMFLKNFRFYLYTKQIHALSCYYCIR